VAPVRVRFEDAEHGVRLMFAGDESGAPTLVFLPCAGGSASSFRPLIGRLPASWRAVAIDPPGHGFNRGVLYDRIEDMARIYGEVLAPRLVGRRYYLVGHSLGGIVGFLLARQLEQRGPRPEGLFVLAARGPRQVVDEHWSLLDDDSLIRKMDAIGGIPEVFRDALEDFKAYLPPVRADFRALERFVLHDPMPLSTRMWVVATNADRFVATSRAREWIEYGLDASFHVLEGGHFFVQYEVEPLVALLESAIE